jgi:hypothetical protein
VLKLDEGIKEAAVVLSDKDCVVLKPPVRLVRVEVRVDPLSVRERMRKGLLSMKAVFQRGGEDDGGEALLLA